MSVADAPPCRARPGSNTSRSSTPSPRSRMAIEDGHALAPDTPGLGIEWDWNAHAGRAGRTRRASAERIRSPTMTAAPCRQDRLPHRRRPGHRPRHRAGLRARGRARDRHRHRPRRPRRAGHATAAAEVRILDVTDAAAIVAAASAVGPIDVLFNGAGFVHAGTVLDCTEDEWDFAFDLNVRSMCAHDPGLPARHARRGGRARSSTSPRSPAASRACPTASSTAPPRPP